MAIPGVPNGCYKNHHLLALVSCGKAEDLRANQKELPDDLNYFEESILTRHQSKIKASLISAKAPHRKTEFRHLGIGLDGAAVIAHARTASAVTAYLHLERRSTDRRVDVRSTRQYGLSTQRSTTPLGKTAARPQIPQTRHQTGGLCGRLAPHLRVRPGESCLAPPSRSTAPTVPTGVAVRSASRHEMNDSCLVRKPRSPWFHRETAKGLRRERSRACISSQLIFARLYPNTVGYAFLSAPKHEAGSRLWRRGSPRSFGRPLCQHRSPADFKQ